MKQIVTGIVAHVDAGKTTLSEGLLFTSGSIRKMGKVDHRDAFLDTDEMERARGITIYSKQAGIKWNDTEITILDTPGHVDFSAEMERVLQVLDYAILVISGPDGVQGHTETLWQLLEKYHVPVFLFINKMDQNGTDKNRVLEQLKNRLDGNSIDFSDCSVPEFAEEVASCDEDAMEEYFANDAVTDDTVRRLILERKIFPCYFGAALKLSGVREFLDGFVAYTCEKSYPTDFGAKVFKISRDEQDNRLTHMKITGGTLRVKDVLSGKMLPSECISDAHLEEEDIWNEKVNQIRLYSGEKYETPREVQAGQICVVTGLTQTWPGQGLGIEPESDKAMLEPVLSRQILLPEGMDAALMMPKLKILAEEQPELHIVWDETAKEIQAQVMGEVQIEILQALIRSRFGVDVAFGPTHIVYRETIAAPVEGVGHFEPLRHYAEVHLLLEPLPRGSGMQFRTDCSEDLLDKNWQRLILTHLKERVHRGVLTRSAVTDMRITVVAGRAHQKHTMGGDFRQATYRAVRQGLMQAESVLLEPYYDFRLELPEGLIGRAMTDIEKMHGHFEAPYKDGDMTVLTGYAPVVTMQDYKQEVTAYSKGFGRLSFALRGYDACHDQEEVVAQIGYNPETDLRNTADSVFCAQGSGFVVPWYEVPKYMHVESPFAEKDSPTEETGTEEIRHSIEDEWIGTDEVDAILNRTYNANRRDKSAPRRGVVKRHSNAEYVAPVQRSFHKEPMREQYLLVDGYNIIYAWEDLNDLARDNMDSARGKLMDALCNYQGYKKMNLIVVFDAYRVKGHETEISDYHNIHVVFTKEAETADQYIEKFAHTNGVKYDVTVATSDGLEQVIIRGAGCRLLSARDLKTEMEQASENMRYNYIDSQPVTKNRAMEEALKKINKDIEK